MLDPKYVLGSGPVKLCTWQCRKKQLPHLFVCNYFQEIVEGHLSVYSRLSEKFIAAIATFTN